MVGFNGRFDYSYCGKQVRALFGQANATDWFSTEAEARQAASDLEKGPWQVKDFADGWIDVPDLQSAKRLSHVQSGAVIRPLVSAT